MVTAESTSVATISSLVERSDGLWEFHGESFDDHVDVFLSIDSKVNSAQWAMAAVAASIETKYGESKIEEFATKVQRTPRHIRRMARTYKLALEKGRWRPLLTFGHHTEALNHPNPGEALDVAESQNLSTLGLREWVNGRAEERATKPQKAAKAKRQNEFKDFLERVDKVILTDFMATCPNAEWGRRVFKGWREDITWELGQIARTEISDRVSDALAEGALTVADIKSKTGLTVKEIEGVVAGKVADGTWEMVREGGETEMSRGTRRMIIHVAGEACFA